MTGYEELMRKYNISETDVAHKRAILRDHPEEALHEIIDMLYQLAIAIREGYIDDRAYDPRDMKKR